MGTLPIKCLAPSKWWELGQLPELCSYMRISNTWTPFCWETIYGEKRARHSQVGIFLDAEVPAHVLQV